MKSEFSIVCGVTLYPRAVRNASIASFFSVRVAGVRHRVTEVELIRSP